MIYIYYNLPFQQGLDLERQRLSSSRRDGLADIERSAELGFSVVIQGSCEVLGEGSHPHFPKMNAGSEVKLHGQGANEQSETKW